jgi:hypothetical protein
MDLELNLIQKTSKPIKQDQGVGECEYNGMSLSGEIRLLAHELVIHVPLG